MIGVQKLQGSVTSDKKNVAMLHEEKRKLAAHRRHRRIKMKMAKKSRARNRRK